MRRSVVPGREVSYGAAYVLEHGSIEEVQVRRGYAGCAAFIHSAERGNLLY